MGHGTPGLKVGDSVQAGFFEHEGRWLIRFAPASIDAVRQQLALKSDQTAAFRAHQRFSATDRGASPVRGRRPTPTGDTT